MTLPVINLLVPPLLLHLGRQAAPTRLGAVHLLILLLHSSVDMEVHGTLFEAFVDVANDVVMFCGSSSRRQRAGRGYT